MYLTRGKNTKWLKITISWTKTLKFDATTLYYFINAKLSTISYWKVFKPILPINLSCTSQVLEERMLTIYVVYKQSKNTNQTNIPEIFNELDIKSGNKCAQDHLGEVLCN